MKLCGAIGERCEAQTLRGRRCFSKPSGRHNGLDLCGKHMAKSKAVFDAAEKRWKDAGEPEGDL